ncbi:MAG: DUF5696 domain-containing protein [Oscillospiraceae bacterium]
MNKKLKKFAVIALVLAMMMPFGSAVVNAENTDADEASVSDSADGAAAEETSDDSVKPVTEDEAMAKMKLLCENDKLALYFDETETHLALKVKENGYIWWSEPFNADAAVNTKPAQIKDLKSSLIISDSSNDTTTSSFASCVDENAKGEVKIKEIENGVRVDYVFSKKLGITIPVEYTLNGDYLEAKIIGKDIKESKKDAEAQVLLTAVSLLPSFGAADNTEEGYFVIPDGSGAVINFNNGKDTYSKYSKMVYGRDITEVLLKKEAKTQQVYLPMYGIVKQDNAILAIADEGAERATLNAYVNGQNSSSYNSAYFSFTVRAKDTYYIANDTQNPLPMYESANTELQDYSVRYYPIAKTGADYVTVAEKYRDYLKDEIGVTKKTEANDAAVYVDLYGGVYKETSVLGVPVNLKTAATTYDQAREILAELKSAGVENIVVDYKDWSNSAISQKVATKYDPAGKLGGKSDLKDLREYAAENGIPLYLDMEFVEFSKGGNGYNTLTDATVRLTKAYSRQTAYDLAWNIEHLTKSKWSLLSPVEFEGVFDKISKAFTKNEITNVSLGTSSYKLYGDYGKNGMNRTGMAQTVKAGYEKLDSEVGSILADTANQYVLGSVDHITNVPLYSSGYDIFDYDIPFYQIVIHGLIPYSTTAINGSADSDQLFMLALSTGSNLGYDFLYRDNKALQNTDYNELFYANFAGWSETVKNQYDLISDIVKPLSDQLITGHKQVSKTVTETTFENGTVIVVDKELNTVKVNGKEINLADYNLKGGN